MRIKWYCGSFSFDRNECGYEFVTDVNDDDWDMERTSAVCPRCGAELIQKYDLPEVVNE